MCTASFVQISHSTANYTLDLNGRRCKEFAAAIDAISCVRTRLTAHWTVRNLHAKSEKKIIINYFFLVSTSLTKENLTIGKYKIIKKKQYSPLSPLQDTIAVKHVTTWFDGGYTITLNVFLQTNCAFYCIHCGYYFKSTLTRFTMKILLLKSN